MSPGCFALLGCCVILSAGFVVTAIQLASYRNALGRMSFHVVDYEEALRKIMDFDHAEDCKQSRRVPATACCCNELCQEELAEDVLRKWLAL